MEVNNENSLIPWILLLVVLQHSSLVERQKRSEKAVAKKNKNYGSERREVSKSAWKSVDPSTY